MPLQGRYAVSASMGRDQAAYHIRGDGEVFEAENPGQRLKARFQADGVEIETGQAVWGLMPIGWGYGDGLNPFDRAKMQARDNRVEYGRGHVTEWYVNGPFGLQQGFTLEQRPSEGQGVLSLRLSVGGGLEPEIDKDRRGMSLRNRAGGVVLRYSGLTVMDANGREAEAWLEANGGELLLLQVKDDGLAFPVVIDPFIQSAKLTASDGAANDNFGVSVSVSGDVVVVGANYDQVGANALQGSAYVFSDTEIRNTYSLSLALSGQGTGGVTSSPTGISCPGTCSGRFAKGGTVTLAATPDAGSAFDGWSGGGCTGNGPCVLTMDQDKTVTAVFNLDSDGDGISDSIENAGYVNGDGNGNGTLDRFENNVVTFRTIYGDYITLVAQAGTTFKRVVAQGSPSPADAPSGGFGCGFFGFTLEGLAPGSSTTVTVILHNKPSYFSCYRYGPTPNNPQNHWYDFSYNGRTGAVFSEQGGKTIVTLHFKDGDLGDDDLTANGVIVDVGGPLTVLASGAGEGGGGGGCFIGTVTE